MKDLGIFCLSWQHISQNILKSHLTVTLHFICILCCCHKIENKNSFIVAFAKPEVPQGTWKYHFAKIPPRPAWKRPQRDSSYVLSCLKKRESQLTFVLHMKYPKYLKKPATIWHEIISVFQRQMKGLNTCWKYPFFLSCDFEAVAWNFLWKNPLTDGNTPNHIHFGKSSLKNLAPAKKYPSQHR